MSRRARSLAPKGGGNGRVLRPVSPAMLCVYLFIQNRTNIDSGGVGFVEIALCRSG